jgi:excinuclease UvrABC nuclease subunit
MQLKGPFKLTEQNLYFVPSKPGVYLLGDQEGKVVYVGRSDSDLARRLRDQVNAGHIAATQFWYGDTWSQQEAAELEDVLSRKYAPSGNTVAH